MQIMTYPSRARPALAAAIFFAAASFAFSQVAPVNPTATPATAEPKDKSTVQLEKFQVTDSKVDGLNNKTIFRTDEKAPLPYNVISSLEIERMGATNIQEIFRSLPQITNYGFSTQANASMVNVTGGDTLSNDSAGLRGFANSQTVVLVNGRRINGVLGLNNIATFAADISKIPIAMIDRIEILPASAGAIYGGGAIGGAINVILKKSYNLKEFTTYFGSSTQGGGTEYRLSYVQGQTFNKGKDQLTVTLDYSHREAIKGYQRNYYKRALAKYPANTPLKTATGVSAYEAYIIPSFASSPGTLIASALPTAASGTQLNIPGNPTARFAGVPLGLNDAQAQALTPASFTSTAGIANGVGGKPRFGNLNLYTPNETYAWNVDYEHIFKPDRLSLFFQFSGSSARLRQSYPQFLSIALSATHPLNPFRTGVTPGFVGVPVTYRFDNPDIPLASTTQDRDDARTVLGLKGKIGTRWEWTLSAAGQYTRTYVSGKSPDSYLSTIMTRAGPTDPGYLGTAVVTGGPIAPTTSISYRWTNVYNPFIDHNQSPISAATVAKYFFADRLATNYERSVNLEGRVVGTAVELPAGPLLVSPGFDLQFIDEEVNQFGFFAPGLTDPAIYGQLASNNGFQNQKSPASLTNKAFYFETTVPVIGKSFRPVPLHSLELGASARSDRPNHARAADTSTLSASLGLTRDIAFRTSLTEGYSLLSASNFAPPTTIFNVTTSVIDPLRGNNTQTIVIPTQISGGNPALKAQSGRSKNLGVILTPRFLPGLSWQIDYWRIKQFNTNAVPTLAGILQTPANYPDRLVRGPLTAEDRALGYTGGPILSVNLTRINIAQANTDGFDSRLSYRLKLPQPEWGDLDLTTNTTFTNSYRTQALPNGPKLNTVGAASGNNPLKWKGYAQLTWLRGNWNIGTQANYTDKFKNGTTAASALFPTATGVDGAYIPSSVTFNLNLGYNIPFKADSGGWRNWVTGTRWTLGVLNVFDREPPLVSDGTSFYSRYADPRQRYLYMQMKKSL
jgi:outer membrane receptor protein involved in Fe transport